MNSQEEEIHLLDYWRILYKRRRVAIIFFCVVVGIVAVYSFTATPIYMGTTQVLVEPDKNQTLNFAEDRTTAIIQAGNPDQYFNTQKEILSSRAFGDRVVRKMQLDKNPYFLDLKNKKNGSFISLIREKISGLFPEKAKAVDPFPNFALKPELDPALTNIVLKNLTLGIGRRSYIMKINYSSPNPSIAAVMSIGIAGAFLEHSLEIRVKPYRDAAEWLSARLMESKGKVTETEKTLQQYRESTGMVSFEAKENVTTQHLQELVTQLTETESTRQEAGIKYKQIESVIDHPAQLAAVPAIMNNQVIQGLRTDELALKKQLSELSTKFGPKHPQIIKTQSQLDMVQKNIIAEARKMLNSAKTEYEIAKNRELSLRKSIDDQKQEVLNMTRKAINFNVISGEAESNKQFYDLLLKKWQEASLSSGVSISNVQIVDYATIPKSPVKPRRGLYLLLAALVGLFGGALAAFFTDYIDDTIKNADDVDKALGLPFLDIVPLNKDKKGTLSLVSDPNSAAAESYRTIRTGLMLSSPSQPSKVIILTSAVPNEGKTTVSANLAVAMSQMGEKVLLVDGDLRKSDLHKYFDLSFDLGLSDVIIDPTNLPRAIKSSAQYPHLDIIAGGTKAPSPLELLGSEQMKTFIAQMKGKYDRVIIDSPPLLAFSDPLVLSSLADGVIMVVWGGETSRTIIQKAIQLLKGIDTRIIGVVLNKIDTTRKDYYYYYPYYYSYYYSDGEKKKKSKK